VNSMTKKKKTIQTWRMMMKTKNNEENKNKIESQLKGNEIRRNGKAESRNPQEGTFSISSSVYMYMWDI
jgi:hypothetical protein